MPDVYVTDTHGLLWFLAGSSRLSDAARSVFRNGLAGRATIYVPVIAVAEMIWAVKAGRVEADVKRLLATIRTHYVVGPLTMNDVAQLPDLPDTLEMHDRMIVWETMKRKATLITRDKIIQETNLVPTIW